MTKPMLLTHMKALVTRNIAFQLNDAVEKSTILVKTLVFKSNLAEDIPRESIDIKEITSNS